MKKQIRRWIFAATVTLLTICAPRIGVGVDRLIWRASGTIDSISANSVIVSRFAYKLTPTTIYEKSHRQASLSSFAVGDRVKVTFITDRSVLRLEGESPRENTPSSTPTPDATPNISRLTAKLSPLGVSEALGNAAGSYSETESKFTATIKVPRNTIPLATTNSEAKALSVKATITRRGTIVATCTAPFSLNRRTPSVFEFKTEIERNGGIGSTNLRSRKGRCVLANGSVGIPTVRSGDRMTVSEETAGEFLRGKF